MHKHEGTTHLLPPHPEKEQEIESVENPIQKGIHIYMYSSLACIIGRWFTATTTDVFLGLDYFEEYIYNTIHSPSFC
jgi:hypothetical protein